MFANQTNVFVNQTNASVFFPIHCFQTNVFYKKQMFVNIKQNN